MRPKFCPNCASPLLDGPQGAQGVFNSGMGSDKGWDCFCDACYWSGDIFPNFETEAAMAAAKKRSEEEIP